MRRPGTTLRASVRLPPALRPGDRVAIFAGSSPFDATLAWRGLGWLASRYRVVFDRSMFSRRGYLAGDDGRRRDELEKYLGDPTVRALVAVRGGYGLSRIAHELPWSLLQRHPRWVVGFSDVTALHVEASSVGVASIHGPMVAALGRADGWTRSRFVEILENPGGAWALRGLEALRRGQARGPLVGGNLTMLHACAAAGRLALPEGCLLDLEVEAKELMLRLVPNTDSAVVEAYRSMRDELGRRPSPSELFHHGYLPRTLAASFGSWFGFISEDNDLTESERQVFASFGSWLAMLEATSLCFCLFSLQQGIRRTNHTRVFLARSIAKSQHLAKQFEKRIPTLYLVNFGGSDYIKLGPEALSPLQ